MKIAGLTKWARPQLDFSQEPHIDTLKITELPTPLPFPNTEKKAEN